MGRLDSPSDLDYFDEGRTHSGIERSCHRCGEPVMVDRSEVYLVHVFCDQCIQEMDAAKQRRLERAKGDAA